MQKPLIVVTRRIHFEALQKLNELGDLKIWEGDGPIDPITFAAWLKTADACLTMLTDRVDELALSQAPHLKIVSNMAVGYDNFDLKAATARHIMMTNTPDVLTEATAELTWALILALMRNIVPARDDLLAGKWTTWRPDGFLGTEVSGKTLGIVGLGRIGRAVARRAFAFNMPVIAWARDGRATIEERIPRAARSQFLARADVVTLHVPLTPQTYHLVDKDWLKAMKPSAFLINTARGGVVDEIALKSALDRNELAGAALDVFAQEPVDARHPLASHPRVLATPHIGSATNETRKAMALRAVANIRAALSGHVPPDLLNPDSLLSNG
ncbi:MAG: D-glycerate dehydrogenase [Sulfobacillus acidophilus]|uniref:D-glycerate dehydrogenase n=1 Tax=Sulfobacillus acidophilus TaxID=53633 RepID=A0A2T2WL24_9FIRM|nr:MAG: D-glycerate dehydrogenase [Sulfobacillus acidophilus]